LVAPLALDPLKLVHLAIVVDGLVRPLCGDWGKSKNWANKRESVTCPQCLEALARQQESRST
jgi:hypothetical protein